MKRNTLLYLLLFIWAAAAFFQTGCSKSKEVLFEEAIQRYTNGDKKALAEIETMLLKNSSEANFKARNIKITPFSLYIQNRDDIYIIYPVDKHIEIPNSDKDYYVHVDPKTVAISDGSQISYLDENNNFYEDVVLADEKEQIKSIYISNNSILYYKNFKLFSFSFDSEESEIFIKDSFNPYYKKFYNANFFVKNNRLALITGIAGAYKISIIDIKKQSLLVKNVKASSSSIYFSSNAFYYLSGSTGNWKVTKFNIRNKNKQSITSIKKITDFAFSETGFMYENNKGTFISDYNRKEYKIPFKYMVMGSCAETIVVKHKDRLYCINHDELLKGIQSLSFKIPDLFPK